MRSLTLSPRVRRAWPLLVAAVALSFAALALAWLLDPRAFVPDVLIQIAFVGLTIVVGFTIVDSYVDHITREQWRTPRNYALGAIAAHLCDIASDLYVSFGVAGDLAEKILAGRNCPSSDAAQAFARLEEKVSQLSNAPGRDKSTSDIAVEIHSEVRWDHDQIQSVLTPLVMHTAPDQEIIDALTEFDAATRNLHNAILLHNRVATHAVIPDLTALMRSSSELYSVLCKHWHPLDKS